MLINDQPSANQNQGFIRNSIFSEMRPLAVPFVT